MPRARGDLRAVRPLSATHGRSPRSVDRGRCRHLAVHRLARRSGGARPRSRDSLISPLKPSSRSRTDDSWGEAMTKVTPEREFQMFFAGQLFLERRTGRSGTCARTRLRTVARWRRGSSGTGAVPLPLLHSEVRDRFRGNAPTAQTQRQAVCLGRAFRWPTVQFNSPQPLWLLMRPSFGEGRAASSRRSMIRVPSRKRPRRDRTRQRTGSRQSQVPRLNHPCRCR